MTIEGYKEDLEAVRVNAMMEQIKNELTTAEFMDKVEEGIRAGTVFNGSIIKKTSKSVRLTTKEKYVFNITESEVAYIGTAEEQEEGIVNLNKTNTEFIYEPSEPTKGKVKVKIKVTLEEEEAGRIQYSLDEGKTWTEYTKEIEVEDNGTQIIARIINSKGKTGTAFTGNVTNIDRVDPKSVSITNAEPSMSTIEIEAVAEDAEATAKDGKSGIAKYYFSKDNGVTWEPEKGQASRTYTFTELTQNTAYTIKVKAEDKAGNSKISEGRNVTTTEMTGATGNVTFTYNPEGWTNNEVEVTITKEEAVKDYTLEYSIDNKTWQEYKGAFKVSNNGEIYARLKDKVGNTGGVATGDVTKIDKLPPKEFTASGESTYDSITLTGSTEDSEAIATSGSSGIKAYYYSKDNGTTWEPENGTQETSYTFENLLEQTTYTLKMKAVDNVGRETETEAITIATKKMPKPEIGDYVDYSPDIASTYNLLGKYSGFLEDQSISQEKLDWQIFKIHEDGSIDLIGTPTLTDVYLEGALGYNNGVYLLNDMCKELYSKPSKGVYARSINLEDFEETMTDAGKVARDAYYEGYAKITYNETRTFTGAYRYYPDLYAKENGSGINTTTTKIDGITRSDKGYESLTEETVSQTSERGVTITQTVYEINLEEKYYGLHASILRFSSAYWVASRGVSAWYTGDAWFGIMGAGSAFGRNFLINSRQEKQAGYGRLRPFVSLKYNVKLSLTEEGTNSVTNPHKIVNY